MIRFPCRCGHLFEEPDEAANSAVQCPACHLLVDVPGLGDVASIGLDGTYAVEARHSRSSPDQLAETVELFTPARTDAEGNSIDLRSAAGDLDTIGDYDTMDQSKRRQRPRDDPETGELVQAIPFAEKPKPAAPIPFAKAAVTYVADGAIRPRTIGDVLLDLVQPLNLFVMSFVLVIHVVAIACSGMMVMGSGMGTQVLVMSILLIGPVLAASVVAILAHYPLVIDAIGVDEDNELPRLLRDLRMLDDVFWPFARSVLALLICFGPSAAAFFLIDDFWPAMLLALPLALPGIALFPAVILTLQTSGYLANLRPDRVVGMMRISGKRYVAIVMLFAAAVLPYAAAIFSLSVLCGLIPSSAGIPAAIGKLALSLPLVGVGVFLMHAFCWELGLLYRADSERFPWAGRFHVRDEEKPIIRRKRRYAAGESNPNPMLLAAERDRTFRQPRTP